MMRVTTIAATLAVLLASAPPAHAQRQTPLSFRTLGSATSPVFGQVDFGGRVTTVTGDQARYQRYRDLRDGAFLDIPVYYRETSTWWTQMSVRSAGYRDQRYLLEAARPGKIRLRFLYDQTPTFISNDTRTPYTPRPEENGFYDTPGTTLGLPDAVQARIQQDPALIRPEIESLAAGFPSRLRRDTIGFDVTVDFTENWQTTLKYQNTRKQGSIPWGASLGFNLPIEIALPIETTTDDVGAALEWGNDRGMFRVGYEGSWFDQGVPSYVWDSPLRLADATNSRAYVAGDGTSRGRGSQWPSNSFYYLNFAGSYRLRPRTSLNGTVSLGQASQDAALLPYTINSAIPGLSDASTLARQTAEAQADIGAATLNFVTRPARRMRFNARYRFTRYDNNTPPFDRTEYVRLDQVAEEGGPPRFQGYTRNYLDVDASYLGPAYTTFRIGYGYQGSDFEERVYFKTNDNTFRASVDTVGNQYVSFRSLYEHSQRRGDGFHAAVLEDAGEQPGMRHFDVAARDRDRFTVGTTVMPTGDLSLNGSIAWTRDDYLNPEQPRNNSFGLLDYKTQTYGVGVDYLPGDDLGMGASYNYDKYTGLSQLRNASPGDEFTDPNRNWTTDEDQRGHSFLAYLELPQLIRKTEVRLDYDYTRYNGMYVYTTGPAYQPSPDAPGGVSQLPELTAREHRATVDLRYFIRSDVAIGVAYWYDNYQVEDFALGPPGEAFVQGIARPPIFEDQAPDSPLNGIVLNYVYRPYTSHTAWVRLTYLW